jgi:integrase
MAVKVKQHKGKWWVFIDHRGKRKAKKVGSKEAAEAVAKRIEATLTLGDFSILEEKPLRPFGPAFRVWLNLYATVHCKPSTVAGYETAFRVYLEPRFANTNVGELTRGQVQRLIADMQAAGKSRSYIKATLAPLSEFLNHPEWRVSGLCQGATRAPEHPHDGGHLRPLGARREQGSGG